MNKVLIISTGGTIISSGASATQLTGYSIRDLGIESLLKSLPELKEIADIEFEEIFRIPSSGISSEDWILLARKIQEASKREDLHGIVVTHGTDTLEETAFFLNLVLKTEKPVAITGSMRPATALSPDGPLNLFNAVALAASADAVGKGVLVSMNGKIFGACECSKLNTLAVETFGSLDYGMLGYCIGGKVRILRESLLPHTLNTPFRVEDLPEKGLLPWVEILYQRGDGRLDLFEYCLSQNIKGIVLAACGHATIPPKMEKLIEDGKTQKCVLVRASRTPSGSVLNGKTEWQEAGVIPSGTLNPQKAAVLLQLALNKYGEDKVRIKEVFEKF